MTEHPADGVTCAGCGATGRAGAVVAGWTVSRPPRPVGRIGPRTADELRETALCPTCARRHLRDLEARLDP